MSSRIQAVAPQHPRRQCTHIVSPIITVNDENITVEPPPNDPATRGKTSEAPQSHNSEPQEETNEEGHTENVVDANPVGYVLPTEGNPDNVEPQKSKRCRQRPSVYKDFQCDPKVPAGHTSAPGLEKIVSNLNNSGNNIKIAPDVSVPPGEFLSIAQRTQHISAQVMDSIMRFLSTHQTARGFSVCFCDTSMPATLMQKLYFPFNLDQKHWAGVCVDTKDAAVYILDCNTSFKSESQIKKELNPIAVIFAYIMRAGDPASSTVTLKPFSVIRCSGIPQKTTPLDAAINTVLLIKGHSASGLEGCKVITASVLPDAAKMFVIRFYEYISDNSGLPKTE
ncbi:hypothetical protein Bca4012_026728 [Brassica carinata]